MAAYDLTTPDEVAAALGIPVTPSMARTVSVASLRIAGYCGRVFERLARIEAPASAGRQWLRLQHAPIVEVERVEEWGQPLLPDTYTVDTEAGMLLRDDGLWPTTERLVWELSTPRPLDAVPAESILLVTYEAGWVTPGQFAEDGSLEVDLPEDVQEAAIILSSSIWRGRMRDPSIASESLGAWAVSYVRDSALKIDQFPDALDLPSDVIGLLARYVRL